MASVKERADSITAGVNDPDGKARAIYDWIVDHTVRDPDVHGCGIGDVKSLLASGSLKGKCADLSSLFVGLALGQRHSGAGGVRTTRRGIGDSRVSGERRETTRRPNTAVPSTTQLPGTGGSPSTRPTCGS